MESESVRVALAELQFVAQLERARLIRDVDENLFDLDAMDRAYVQAFAANGVDVLEAPLSDVSQRLLSQTAIARAIVAALDDWAGAIRVRMPSRARRLAQISHMIDDNPVRHRIRQAILDGQHEILEEIASSANLSAHPAATLWLLGVAQRDANHRARILRVGQLQYPGDFWINFSLGLNLILSRPEQLQEGAKSLQVALAIRPDAKIRATLGHTLARLDQLEEAEALLRTAIETHPKHAPNYWALGLVHQKRHNFEEAIALNRKAIELAPDLAIAHSDLGANLRELKQFDEAVAAQKKAIEISPQLVWAWNGLGLALLSQGRIDEAIAAYRKAIELDPKWYYARVNLGNALFQKGLVDEAIACCRKAIEIDPKCVAAHTSLGNMLLPGQVDEAIACYRTAIELDPKCIVAHVNLGNALTTNKDLEGAVRHYRKAIELNPNFALAHYNLGFALSKQKNLDGAIAAYRKAVQLEPDFAQGYYQLGIELQNQRKLAQAAQAYQKAIQIKPDYAEAHCNLGHVWLRQWRLTDGLASLRRGHELGSKKPGWPYPSAQWVRQAERREVELDAKLSKTLKNETQLTNARESLELAEFCQFHKK